MTFISHIHRMHLLIDHEEQRVSNLRHLAFIVLNIEILRLLHQLLHARLAEELDERLIFRKSLMATEKKFRTLVLLAFGDSLLGVVQCLGNQCSLTAVKLLDIRSEKLELLVILSLGYRTGNNERSSGVIDKD